AQRLPGSGLPADGPVGITGYSQGGGASAAAAELAATYAPELDLRGAYVGAPPADLAVLAESLDGSYTAGFLAFALVGLDTAYPQLDIPGLANAQGKQLFAEASTVCAGDAIFRYAFRRTSSLTADGRPVADYTDEEPFLSVLEGARIGNVAPDVPTLVEHAPGDDVVPYEQGRQMARDWCEGGATVQFNNLSAFLPIFQHLLAALNTSQSSAEWLTDRFNGEPAPSNCGSF
ncbi:lipase family protein, partial [Streptomyces specialis]|uniref:lipase family protein n=1 Tax=Streptomyces specialis TaxID=498367 RepID=UPI000AA57C0A